MDQSKGNAAGVPGGAVLNAAWLPAAGRPLGPSSGAR